MDQTLIDLATFFIGGMGLVVVLTKVTVPHLNKSFWDHNPFPEKNDTIATVMNWVYSVPAILGLLAQIVCLIFQPEIPERLYDSDVYLSFSFCSFLISIVLFYALRKLGRFIAYKSWFPQMVSAYKNSFDSAEFVITHNWLRHDQIHLLSEPDADLSQYQNANRGTVERVVALIEDALEKGKKTDTIDKRIAHLREYFYDDGA